MNIFATFVVVVVADVGCVLCVRINFTFILTFIGRTYSLEMDFVYFDFRFADGIGIYPSDAHALCHSRFQRRNKK